MTRLILDYKTIYDKVAEFLGLVPHGTTPTGTDLTVVKAIVARGYRRFLYPLNSQTGEVYVWSFLKKVDTLTTVIGQSDYALPSNFVSLVSGFKLNAGEDKKNPIKIDVSKLRAFRNTSVTTGTPNYYAVNIGSYDAETGAFYSVSFYRPPDAALTYKYTYIFDPLEPSATTDKFVGGAVASEVILNCSLAAAELQEDEVPGPKELKAAQAIITLMEYDKRYAPDAIEIDPNILSNIPRFRRLLELQGMTPPSTGV